MQDFLGEEGESEHADLEPGEAVSAIKGRRFKNRQKPTRDPEMYEFSDYLLE